MSVRVGDKVIEVLDPACRNGQHVSMPPRPPPRILPTGAGSDTGEFTTRHWAWLLANATIFGSAFLWISMSLRGFPAPVVAVGRVALGCGVLAVLPASRRRIARADWPLLVLVGIVGQGGPALLFAMAEQRISSALTGMLVSASPIATVVIAAILTRTAPTTRRIIGLAVGSIGVLLLVSPALGNSSARPGGVLLVLLAVTGYGLAGNLYVPLQQRYGAIPVAMWALAVATVLLIPVAAPSFGDIEWRVDSVVALVILGVLGTGLGRAMIITLFGRVGAARGSIVAYIVPIMALVLGVVALGESVEVIQVAGVGVALLGGWLVSRQE